MSKYECPTCKNPDCETYEDDQRFDIDAPGGVQTVGSVYLLSTCCDATIAINDEFEPEEIE